MSDMRIGLIGLGYMGAGMAKNLLKHGYQLTVHNRSQGPVERLVALGATAAASPADLARQVDIVFTVLPDGPDVERVVSGPGGVLEGARPGLLMVECSTIDPSVTGRVREALEAKGCRMVDAPLGRGSKQAEEGTLVFMVGATEDDFRQVLPVLQAMGTEIIRCGGPGAGIIVKVANNMLAQTILAANIEALLLGVKAGVEVEPMLQVFQLTGADNGQLRTQIPGQVLPRNFQPGFKLSLAEKDQRLGQALAAKLGMPLFTLATARHLFQIAIEQGRGDLAAPAVVEVFEQFGGVKLADD